MKKVATAAAAGGGEGGGGGGGGKINAAQASFNELVSERIDGLDKDVQMLKRIDTKMNKELV